MKMPVVTVTLVSAALLYVLWDQTRGTPATTGADRFSNLAANPVSRGDVLDFVVSRVPVLCSEATGRDSGETFNDCVQLANSRSSSCRRTMVGQFPDNVMSEAVFRDLSITMINCLVPQSGVVQP